MLLPRESDSVGVNLVLYFKVNIPRRDDINDIMVRPIVKYRVYSILNVRSVYPKWPSN